MIKKSKTKALMDEERGLMKEKEAKSGEGTKVKRKDIQGLRGVAILCVLTFHLYPNLFPHGFLGVDIFFVISGYLITMILCRPQHLTIQDVLTFYSKRIRRIFPAYYLVIFLIISVGSLYLASEDYRILRTDTLWAAALATNIHKYIQNADYFAETAIYDFVLHTWSLAAEIQYYVVAPLLIFIFTKGTFGKVFYALTFLLSLYINLTASGPLQFSSLFSRIWQFLCGTAAYHCSKLDFTEFQRKILAFFGLISVFLLIFTSALKDWQLRLIVTIGSALLIAVNERSIVEHYLGNKVLYFIGEISYSVYLFHWPIILYLKYGGNSEVLTWKDAIIAAELSLFAGAAAFRVVEKHFIINKTIQTLSFVTALIFGTTYFCVIFVPYSIIASKVQQKLGSTNNFSYPPSRFLRSCYHFHETPYLPVNLTQAVLDRAIVQNKIFIANSLPFYMKDYNLTDPLYEKYFVATKTQIDFPDYYKGNGSLSVAVIGNSYARSAFFAIIEALGKDLKEIRLAAFRACQPFFDSVKAIAKDKPYGHKCDPFFKQTVSLLDEMKPEIIFIVFRPGYEVVYKFDNIDKDEQMQLMQKTMDHFSKFSKAIIIQMPLPVDDRPYSDMMVKVIEKKQTFEGIYIDSAKFHKFIYYGVKRLEHLRCDKCIRIYPHRIFCDKKICRTFDPENLFSFFDTLSHYNPYAHQCIIKLYRETLDELFIDWANIPQKNA